ncbi:MAG: ABC transporter substrate-binding protein [Chloroflexota bacterium]|nr:ABC transporter substrate-binding protein [Chloroflexota bacterium]
MDVEPAERRAFGRRAFLLGALGATTASVLAACAQPSAAPTPAPAATTAPKPAASPAASPSPSPSPSPAASPAAAASPLAKPAASPVAAASPSPAGVTAYTLNNPPAVQNAAAARAFANQRITYYGDGVGLGNDIDKALAGRFQQDTGIQVNVIPRPQSATDTFAQYQRFFQGQSADIDVMMVDVIWPGSLAAHLVDLAPKLGDDAKQHYPGIIENNTVDGKLVGIPWFGDFGMLYYRTDLLQKYSISAPPRTWDELEEQARRIVDGERSSNPNFGGFVFQGNAYEGLTCDALEWLASSGGGTIIDASSKVTVNNPQAVAILNKIRGWVGNVAPRGVTSYQEEEARNAFQGGNAAFMRNWPYAYAAGQKEDSPVRGKFDVAPLPAQAGSKPSGTVGGWQLSVSRYSRAMDAAIEFVRYAASAEVQAYRAVVGTFVPTIPAVAERAEVLQAMPFLRNLASVERVTRPSRALGERYNEGSTAFFQGVNQILNGQDASSVLPNVQRQLERLLG